MRYHGCDDSRDMDEHVRELAIQTAWMRLKPEVKDESETTAAAVGDCEAGNQGDHVELTE